MCFIATTKNIRTIGARNTRVLVEEENGFDNYESYAVQVKVENQEDKFMPPIARYTNVHPGKTFCSSTN